MCRTSWLLVALTALAAGAAEESRTWTSRAGGSAIEAAFVKEEKGVVTLKRKDGATVQAKLDALCDEDREYVLDVTYVPKEITVVFKRGARGFGPAEGQDGEVTARDTAVLRFDLSAGGGAPPDIREDTTWKVESVDALGKRLPPREGGGDKALTTAGAFVFLSYRVKNDSLAPVDVPPPRLFDRQGRVFTQAAPGTARDYIPEGARLAGEEPLQPGFSKLYCAFYELPEDAEPAAVEVLPAAAKPFLAHRTQLGVSGAAVQGKKILLGGGKAAAQPGARQQEEKAAPAAAADDDKPSLFMRCSRLGQSGDQSGQWYYDRSKRRSLTYGVELRAPGGQAQKVKVKAFFIGTASANRDLVVDKKETEVTLEPGKSARTALQSEDIEERTYYYYYLGDRERISGAKLKGVIIQAWSENALLNGWASQNQWRKFADSPDVAKELGELKKSEEGF